MLLAIWSFLKRQFRRTGGGGGRSIGRPWKGHFPDSGKGASGATGPVTICPSRVPSSAPADATGRFLDPDSVPPHLRPSPELSTRRASEVLVRPTHNNTLLHPYAYSNASRSSQDIGLTSVSDCGSEGLRYAQHEPRASRPSSRASSRRGISRVATPSRTRSKSRRRSKSPRRPLPLDLTLQHQHNRPATPDTANVALPSYTSAPPQISAVVEPTPDRKIYPITGVQRYDKNVVMYGSQSSR